MSENRVTPLKWLKHLHFGNGSLRSVVQARPAAPPQVGSEPFAVLKFRCSIRYFGRFPDFRCGLLQRLLREQTVHWRSRQNMAIGEKCEGINTSPAEALHAALLANYSVTCRAIV